MQPLTTPPTSPSPALSFPQTQAVDRLARWMEGRFPEELPDPRRRSLERVAEYPLVLPNGWPVPVHRLWPVLQKADPSLEVESEGETLLALRGPGFSFRAAVGWGMVQVVTGPCADLHALRQAHEAAMARLLAAADTLNVAVLGYGVQPMTPGHPGLLTRRALWQAPLDALGAPWLNLTLTASDQLRVAVRRGELLERLNLGNMVAPAVIALCGHSPIYTMVDSYRCAGRDRLMRAIHPEHERFGFPSRPYASLADRITRVGQMPRLITLDAQSGQFVGTDPENPQSFLDFVDASPEVQQSAADLVGAYLLHEGQTWPSARADAVAGVLSLGAACQQPWPDHMAACALNLGVIEAGMALHDFYFTAVDPPRAPRVRPGVRQPPDPDRVAWDAWPVFVPFYGQAVDKGLLAREPFTGLLEATLRHAEDALRARGLGEEGYLAPLWARLAARENPAQQLRRVFHREGVAGLLRERRVRLTG